MASRDRYHGRAPRLAAIWAVAILLLAGPATAVEAQESSDLRIRLRLVVGDGPDSHGSRAAGDTAALVLESASGALRLELATQEARLLSGAAAGGKVLWRGPVSLAAGEHSLVLKARERSVAVCLDSCRLTEAPVGAGPDPKVSFTPSKAVRLAGPAVLQPAGEIRLADDFARNADEGLLWTVASGRFAGSASLSPDSAQSAFHLWGSAPDGRGVATADGSYWFWDDYRADVSARASELPAAWGIVFYYSDPSNYYAVRWSSAADGAGRLELIRRRGGAEAVLASCERPMLAGQWYRMTVAVRGENVRAFIGGSSVLSAVDATFPLGRAGLMVQGEAGVSFDDFAVASVGPEAATDDWTPPHPLGPAESEWSDFSGKLFSRDEKMLQWAHPRSFWENASPSALAAGEWFRTRIFGDVTFRWDARTGSSCAWPGKPIEVVLFGDRTRLDAGYVFRLEKNSAVVLRGGRELGRSAVAPVKLDSLECSARAGRIEMQVNGKGLLSVTDPDPLAAGEVRADLGPVSGWNLKAADWRDGASVLSSHRLDYGFDAAPAAWATGGGMWRETNRWACVPKWSFCGGRGDVSSTGADPGLAALWNLRRIEGDFDFEVFFAPMEASAQLYHFGWPVTLNVAFAADGRDLGSGYSVVFGTVDLPMKLYRRGREVASFGGFADASMRRQLWALYHRLTETWQHLRVRRLGPRVIVEAGDIDNAGKYHGLKKVMEYDDPEPLAGDRLALWTWGANGMAVARATISFAGSPGAVSATDAVPIRADGRAVVRELAGERGGPAKFLRATNPCSGGHFERELIGGPVDLERTGTVEFDARTSSALAVGLFARVRGQSAEVILYGPERFRSTAIPLGSFSGAAADGKWHRVSFDLLGALRRVWPEGPLVADTVVLASPFESIEEIAGFGVNGAGASYDVANVRLVPSREPPAPPRSSLPSVLVAGMRLVDDFESDLGGWERLGGRDGASLYRDASRPGYGARSLRLVNDSFGGPAGAWISRDGWELARFPGLSFSYRFPPDAQLNLLVRSGGRWFEVRLSGDDSTWPMIGRAEGFTADGEWHRCEIDLASVLSHAPGATPVVEALAVADSASMANRQGMAYWFDDFCCVPALDPKDGIALDLDWGGEKPVAFSHVLSDDPASEPGNEPTGNGSRLVLPGGPGGKYLHVRVRDGAGKWSSTAHIPLIRRSVPPASAGAAEPAGGADAGPPPAPYVSYVPSERLERFDFEWGLSPEWPESRMGEFGTRRQCWVIRDTDAATGAGAVSLVNLNPVDFYSAYMRRSPYDPVRWPRVAFDYRFRQPGCAMNLAFIVNGAMAIVEWTGTNPPQGYFAPSVIGRAEPAIQDGQWHSTDVDLRELLYASLFKDPARRPALAVSDLATWATTHNLSTRWESYQNPPEAQIKIDNFTIYLPSGRDPAFEWKLHHWKGEPSGYSCALDGEPGTIPPERVTHAEPRAAFRGVEPGTWYFHVRAADPQGRWGPAAHRRIIIEKP